MNSAPTRRWRSSARSTRSTCAAGSGWSTWPARSAAARSPADGSRCSGLAFKPNSDDIRDSPALNVAAQMQLQGASVVVTDPQAVENAQRKWPDLRYAESAEEAAEGADLVLLLTEWDQYKALDPDRFGEIVAHKRMLDGRNALDPKTWRAAGWTYRALGRP